MRQTNLFLLLCFTFILLPAWAFAADLAFFRGNEVWVCDAHGKGQRRIASFEELDRYPPSLSADGALVAVSVGNDKETGLGQIHIIPTSGGESRVLGFTGVHSAYCPTFSRDGKLLAMVAASSPHRDPSGGVFADMSLCVAELNGERVRHVITEKNTLLDGGYVFANPSFSPDSSQLAWQESGSDVSGGFQIVNVKGEQTFRFPKDPKAFQPYWRPSFSLDGTMVLCYTPSQEGKAGTTMLVDIESGFQLDIVEGANPTFVSDGDAIVFERLKQGKTPQSQLWRMELTPGSKPELIVENGEAPAGR